MWIITEKRLQDAMEKHPASKAPLLDWMVKMRAARPTQIHELREIFNSVDVAYGLTIFDIGGNNFRVVGYGRMLGTAQPSCFLSSCAGLASCKAKLKSGQTFDVGPLPNFRLITDVVYEIGRVYIKEFLTHAQYDEWNKDMRRS